VGLHVRVAGGVEHDLAAARRVQHVPEPREGFVIIIAACSAWCVRLLAPAPAGPSGKTVMMASPAIRTTSPPYRTTCAQVWEVQPGSVPLRPVRPNFLNRSDLLDDAAEVHGERILQRLRARGVRGDLAEVELGPARRSPRA
jgi:hypothetical protein